jgi:hypothetical protein
MKQLLNENAGLIAAITTACFAVLIWWYAIKGISQTNYFICMGVILAFIDLAVLFSVISTKPTNKKKGTR